MEIDKKINNEELLVNYPVTDGEIFTHLFSGAKPTKRPIKMTRLGLKAHKWITGIFLAVHLTIAGIGFTNYINTNYNGSISKFYKIQMEKLNRAPLNFY